MHIRCKECGKRRVVYSAAKLGQREMQAVIRAEEELIFTCGGSLFPTDHPLSDKLVTRQGVQCVSPIETQYYAGTVTPENRLKWHI